MSILPTLLRRARGVIGIGLIWAIVWAIGGTALFAFLLALFPPPGSADSSFRIALGVVGIWLGIAGALVGSAFAIVLMLAERNRGLAQLSLTRTGVWGALGGAFFPLLAGLQDRLTGGGHLLAGRLIFGTGVLAFMGSACAVGTLALARREPRAQSLPGSPNGRDTKALAD